MIKLFHLKNGLQNATCIWLKKRTIVKNHFLLCWILSTHSYWYSAKFYTLGAGRNWSEWDFLLLLTLGGQIKVVAICNLPRWRGIWIFFGLASFDCCFFIFGLLVCTKLVIWNKLIFRSKFFARLQINEMRMLTDQGLANFFHLFLLIASSNIDNTERLDVFSKMMSHLEQVSFTKTDYRKMKVILNGKLCHG